MSGNKLILDEDGIQVGLTQLTSSGGDISVGKNLTVGGNFTLNGYINGVALEYYNIVPSAAIFDQVLYVNDTNYWFTANAQNNVVPNFLGLKDYAVGSTFYFNILITNGPRAFSIESARVDYANEGVRMRWLGGSTPQASANSVDCYNFQIIKTAATAYTIFGTKASF